MLKPSWTSFLLLSLTTFVAAASPHQAAPMMAAPPHNGIETANPNAVDKDFIIEQFQQVYKKKGKPRIAIFWNRALDDRLSDWQTNERSTQTEEYDLEISDRVARYNRPQSSYAREFEANGGRYSSQFSESRQPEYSRNGFDEYDDFSFSSGFTTSLLRVPVKLIDRNTIMRLALHHNQQSSSRRIIPDHQYVETDALVGYADYLAEILLTPDAESDVGWAFLVTVKSVDDGQVVAMLKSTGVDPSRPAPRERWVGTSNGYVKITEESELTSASEAGEQLAYETMQALYKIWR